MENQRNINLVALAKRQEVVDHLQQSINGIDQIKTTIKHNTSNVATLELLNGARSDILLLDIDLDQERAVPELERIVSLYGSDTPIIVTSPTCPSAQVRQLFHMGVTDYLPQPLDDAELRTAIDRAMKKFQTISSAKQSPRGQIISFLRSCGGAGATTIMVELAKQIRQLSEDGQPAPEVALLDFDLQYGNITTSLDLNPKSTMGSIINAPERLDQNFLRSATVTHKSGLHILSAPETFLPLESLTGETADEILDLSASMYDCTLVDLPHTWSLWTYNVLARSSAIYLIMQLDVTAVRRAHRLIQTIRELELGDLPLTVVANKCDFGIDQKAHVRDASNALGRPIDFLVHRDSKNVDAARNRGVFIGDVSERSAAMRDIRTMAEAVRVTMGLKNQQQQRPAMASFLSRLSPAGGLKTKWR